MTSNPSERAIVVGVDGSASSRGALTWAIREAAARECGIRLVHAGPGDQNDTKLKEYVHATAAELLAGEADFVAAESPGLHVSTVFRDGAPVPSLIGEGDTAELIAIGSRGMGGFASVLLGSVAVALASHITCPLVVVRPAHADSAESPADEPPSAGRIVVGVDDSPHSKAAFEFALTEAKLHDTGVTAVAAWNLTVAPGIMAHLGMDLDVIGKEQSQLLDHLLSDWLTGQTGVDVRSEAPLGHPAHELVRHSRGAELLVVGARGLGGFRGLLLGSVSHAVLHHAMAPVAIIRRK